MRMIRRIVCLPITIVLLLVIGCADPEKELANKILRMPIEQRAGELSQLSAKQQVDVYLYVYRRTEPPVILAGELAKNWRATLPSITSRLENEQNETSIAALMLALSAVSSQYCSLAERNDVLAVAQQAVSRIGPPYRDLAERQLSLMKHPEKQLPPCR